MEKADLKMVMKPEAASDWNMLLRSGFLVPVEGPKPLMDLLEHDLGLDPEYIQKKVATIFLDGKPVDDVDSALVGRGSEVALAGFMPGIAGITMRRNSPVAAMRSQITSKSDGSLPRGPGRVTVRLFSTVAVEAGPGVMARGISLQAADLAEFLGSRDDLFWRGLVSAVMEGERAGRNRLENISPGDLPEHARVVIQTG